MSSIDLRGFAAGKNTACSAIFLPGKPPSYKEQSRSARVRKFVGHVDSVRREYAYNVQSGTTQPEIVRILIGLRQVNQDRQHRPCDCDNECVQYPSFQGEGPKDGQPSGNLLWQVCRPIKKLCPIREGVVDD